MNLEQETDQDECGGTKAPRNLWSPSAVNQTHFCSEKRSTNLLATIHGSTSQKNRDLDTWNTYICNWKKNHLVSI